MRLFFKDKRTAHEQEKDSAYIEALNSLKTLQVTPRGGMSIDPEEIRDLVSDARRAHAQLVPDHSSLGSPCPASSDSDAPDLSGSPDGGS